MKQFKSFLTQLLVITALMLPWSASEALETFSEIGVISSISYLKLSLHNDGDFRFEPNIEFEIPGKANAKLGDFKAGDMVAVSGQIIGGVRYVKRIIYRVIDIE
jgi:hypothetical protein